MEAKDTSGTGAGVAAYFKADAGRSTADGAKKQGGRGGMDDSE